MSAINIVNFGYKRQLLSDLTAVITLSDVFDGQRYRRIAVTPTFTQEYQRTTLGRALYISYVYSFGTSKKDTKSSCEYDQPN